MGQKVNPHGLRVGVIKNWDSRWYAPDKKFGDVLVQDYKIREYIKSTLQDAGVPKAEIERDNTGKIRVFIHCAKPGQVIGRNGENIEKVKAGIEAIAGAPVAVNVIEVKPVDMCAQLVAENIASQLEKRVSFRRAMKQAMGRTMRLGAKGIKVAVSGRLGGAEIARVEHYHEGTIPLQTIRADIDYGFWEAKTTYGKIGVKVWIYKGEVLSEVARTMTGADEKKSRENTGRRDNRGQRRDRRDGAPRGEGRPYQKRDGGRPQGQRDGQRSDSRSPRAPRKETTEGGAN